MSRLRPRLKPGMSRSTTSRLMPFEPGASGSVCATTMTRSALMPLVMNVFEPLSTQPSPSLRARGLDALQVAAGAGLGHRDGGDQLAAGRSRAASAASAPRWPGRAGRGRRRRCAGRSRRRWRRCGSSPRRGRRCSGSRGPRRRRTPPRRPCRAAPARRRSSQTSRGHDAVLLPLRVERGRRSSRPRRGPCRGTRRARPRRGSGACHAVCPRRRRPSRRADRRTVVPPWTLDDVSALDRFSEPTRAWFTGAFVQPTPAQDGAWDAISSGEHALVVAPTGSGKTLAAFLWSLDRLAAAPPPADEQHRCRVLYVSPLKALAVDVERNLRAPLTGIGQAAARLGLARPEIRVGIRSGDTPADERRAMRPPSAGHPDHHARVAVPAADQLGPRGAARGRDGDRRRGARRRRQQARRAPGGLPRPARRAARAAGPADRPVGHRAPDRGGRHLPRRRPPGPRRRAAVARRSGTSRSSSRSRT